MSDRKPVKSQPLAIALTVVYAAVAVVVRLIPRPPNVAVNGALSIYGGARTPVWIAVPLQLLSLVVSDLLLYKLFRWEPFNLPVYASFLIYLVLGRLFLRGNDSLGRIATVTFFGSSQFFLITNFAYWYGQIGTSQQIYDSSLAGLLVCYQRSLLFFGFSLAGDLGFGAVLFGAEAWLEAVIHGEQPAEAPEEVAA